MPETEEPEESIDETGEDQTRESLTESSVTEECVKTLPEGASVPEGYHFVWSDEFDSDSLSSDWLRENHRPGWVNSELQAYTEDEEYCYVSDGHLVIQPVKTEDEKGRTKYYSGRINTYHNAEFKYGYFEARIKVPEGKGFLPAFWMLPTTGEYGNWPSSGEIDIMEVLGGEENKSYATIHYGNPHAQGQGSYTLDEGRFCDDYHVYACEWEPGKISWYVDGDLAWSTGDWYCTVGKFNKDYPAPFNTPFYIILNVAVGGQWPGDPDETTVFDERAQMCVDYVRVFQKDEYDENVTKPEAVLRDPDESGNFVTADWQFYELEGGKGSCDINDGILIKTEDEGKVDYSVQLVNEAIPLKEGKRYRLSFEAKASEDRTIKTAVTGPSKGYIRYLEDQTVELTTELKAFSYEFTMEGETDPAARVEFNMGAAGSIADVSIENVRLETIE